MIVSHTILPATRSRRPWTSQERATDNIRTRSHTEHWRGGLPCPLLLPVQAFCWYVNCAIRVVMLAANQRKQQADLLALTGIRAQQRPFAYSIHNAGMRRCSACLDRPGGPGNHHRERTSTEVPFPSRFCLCKCQHCACAVVAHLTRWPLLPITVRTPADHCSPGYVENQTPGQNDRSDEKTGRMVGMRQMCLQP